MTHDEEIRKKLQDEVDTLPWSELIRHFAFGRVYHVRNGWSLIDAAMVLKGDDAPRLKQAMEDNHFGLATDAEATLWTATAQEFEVLVMSPFILVAPHDPLTEKSL